jgi:nitrate/TMAO reductase-like tetraheme cytochrome c subunit
MKKFLLWFTPGLVVGILIILGAGKAIDKTASNEYCMSCHVHPMADISWKQSVHYETQSGYHTACVECHLPPRGHGYLWAKGKTGLRDLWSYWTKDSSSFNWDERKQLANARVYTYESSCIKCHENLFPAKLTKEGEDAHLYYTQQKKTPELHCINCHLNSGHFIAGYTHGSNNVRSNLLRTKRDIYRAHTRNRV